MTNRLAKEALATIMLARAAQEYGSHRDRQIAFDLLYRFISRGRAAQMAVEAALEAAGAAATDAPLMGDNRMSILKG